MALHFCCCCCKTPSVLRLYPSVHCCYTAAATRMLLMLRLQVKHLRISEQAQEHEDDALSVSLSAVFVVWIPKICCISRNEDFQTKWIWACIAKKTCELMPSVLFFGGGLKMVSVPAAREGRGERFFWTSTKKDSTSSKQNNNKVLMKSII